MRPTPPHNIFFYDCLSALKFIIFTKSTLKVIEIDFPDIFLGYLNLQQRINSFITFLSKRKK